MMKKTFDNPDDAFEELDEATSEADLWFLPPEPELDDLDLYPAARQPRADLPLFPLAEWRAAEADLAADLAGLSYDFGRLEERLKLAGEGVRRRLALQEVSSLGWWMGDRVAVDRLGLWISMQIGATGLDVQALGRGAWAVRRLLSGPAPVGEGAEAALMVLLGVPEGSQVPDRVRDAADMLEVMAPLHQVTRGAILFHLWRQTGSTPAHDLEAAVLAARLAGQMAGEHAFMPISLAGFGALQGRGSAAQRLAGWIAGSHQAVLAALMHLDRLAAWQQRASRLTGDLSGRTPPLLLSLLAEWPSLSAPMAEQGTGASRAAVQRNLDILERRGLIRELTGQGRYRVWAAQL